MYNRFNERVLFKAAKISKKNRILTPFVYFVSAFLLAGYYICVQFYRNSKKCFAVSLALIFFFMCSSFSFPEITQDNEIYLTATEEQVFLAEDIDKLPTVVETTNQELAEIEDSEWIEDSDLYKSIDSSDLAATDNIDTFTLDDFLNQEDIKTATVDSGESGFDKNAWNLILVNKTHPIPDNYEVPLANFSGSMKCDERVFDAITSMLKAAKDEGVDLIVCSPYRDYQLQTRLFNRKIDLYMGKGYSYLEAYKITSEKVTVPGASEHQIGMAFDIVTSSHATLDYEFADTTAGKWLKEHGKEYGFILRYPRGKEYITGIEFEPWHYRYVGVEAATYIMDNEITLEEFIEGL